MQLCVAAFGILHAGSLSPLPMVTDKRSKALGRILTNPQLVYVLEIRMPKLYLLILFQSELQCSRKCHDSSCFAATGLKRASVVSYGAMSQEDPSTKGGTTVVQQECTFSACRDLGFHSQPLPSEIHERHCRHCNTELRIPML